MSVFSLSGQNLSSVTTELDKTIAAKEHFVTIRKKRIALYKSGLMPDMDAKEEYLINQKLYKEYRKFKIDSALYYVKRNIELGGKLESEYFRNQSKIQLANLYSSSGNFLESQAILQKLNSTKLSVDLKALYFEYFSQFFEHYATNNPNQYYGTQIEIYRDSLLNVLDPSDNKYKINLAQRYIYHDKFKQAKDLLATMIDKSMQKNPDYAMCTYLLGDIYTHENNLEQAVKHYSLAAITDIENAIKDHAAAQNLAIYYYDHGKIDTAYKYAQSAMEDAVFCNVKFRTLRMSEFSSIVNAAYQDKEVHAKRKLQLSLVLISFLSIFLIIAVVYVYRQMKKVSQIKEQLSLSGEKLQELNADLQNMNDRLQQFNFQLSESNHIKEEYIAQFFDLCSSYIRKLDDYRKKLNKKAVAKQYDELAVILKSSDFTDDELQELYRKFDTVFVNLYPNFVSEFNALLNPEDRILLKDDEILNTELRIFALERLGITDGVKIAAFLRYSISTIYNYRTKVRNKAVVSRKTFDESLKTIGLDTN